jgi:hypothetical protein
MFTNRTFRDSHERIRAEIQCEVLPPERMGKQKDHSRTGSTFQGSVLSRATVKRWLRKFKSGDLSCLDENRPGRPLTILGPPRNTKFNQYHFFDTVLPNLYSEKRRIARRKGLPSFSVHMDSSVCHNGAKITEKLEKRYIARAPHRPYSPDLSPCDF